VSINAPRDGLRVEEVVCVGRQRAVQGDDVRLAEDRVGGRVDDSHRLEHRVPADVVGKHAAAEACMHDPRNQRADAPGPDHADGSAMQVEAE
jgi:hypothetical protein